MLGAGYMLIEIPLMQRFTLLLDRPVLGLAVVLTTLLFASGLGSLLTPRLEPKRALTTLVVSLGVLSLAIGPIIATALPWPLAVRITLAVLCVFPVGLLMGVPFAAGLRRLQAEASSSISWAWALNGAASGISGVLAAMISLDAGFTVTMAIGTLAYLGARLSWSGLEARSQRSR
jgi:hypothetical protein